MFEREREKDKHRERERVGSPWIHILCCDEDICLLHILGPRHSLGFLVSIMSAGVS